MKFSATLYRAAARDYRTRIKLSDDILYKLCRDHPSHRDPAAVHARLSLIGRSYMTRLEAMLEGDDSQSGNLNEWSEFILKHARIIDRVLADADEEREPLTAGTIVRIARLHGRLVNLLRVRIKQNTDSRMRKKTPTSFVSKYLHFHTSAVPIYDSWASAGVQHHHLLGSERDTLRTMPAGADPDYWHFLRGFWCVYREAEKHLHRWPSVRLLDRYLLKVAERTTAEESQ